MGGLSPEQSTSCSKERLGGKTPQQGPPALFTEEELSLWLLCQSNCFCWIRVDVGTQVLNLQRLVAPHALLSKYRTHMRCFRGLTAEEKQDTERIS